MRIQHWLVVGIAVAAAGCPEFGGDTASSDRDWDGVPNDVDCAPDDPFTWQLQSVYVDGDRDGRGAGEPLSLCLGGGSLSGHSFDGTDCDDAASAYWELADRFADADGDHVGAGGPVPVCVGYSTPPGYVATSSDCAPDDATRWQELGYVARDADLDGVTVPDASVVCSGGALPAGHRMVEAGLDCDDGDAAAYQLLAAWIDGDGDQVGTGAPTNLCTGAGLPAGWADGSGDCAADDATRWQELGYSFVDLDQDGYTIASMGILCAGAWLPSGYRTTPSASGTDCDDGAAALFTLRSGYPDPDADGFGSGTVQSLCSGASLPTGYVSTGTDCAPEDGALWRDYAYTQRDADLDGYTVATPGSLCVGTEPPAGYGTVASSFLDCNDGDPALYKNLAAYLDADGDGFGVAPMLTLCTAGTLPDGYVTNLTDCAGEDPTAWRSVTPLYADRDGDGYTVRETGPFCIGVAPTVPYQATAVGNDCDETDPALYRWVVLYADQDGDGVGVPPRWIPCLGATIPDGWSVFGYDADDADPAVATDPQLLTAVD